MIQGYDLQKTILLVHVPLHQVDESAHLATEVIVQATGNALTKAVTAAEAKALG